MQRHHAAFDALGAQIVAIGQGTPTEAAEQCRHLGASFPCLGDPEKESYRAFGLPRGSWKEILVDPILAGNQAVRSAQRVSIRGSLLRQSDWFQLPGVAVVDRSGTLRYLYRSRHSGDLPPVDALLEAVKGIG